MEDSLMISDETLVLNVKSEHFSQFLINDLNLNKIPSDRQRRSVHFTQTQTELQRKLKLENSFIPALSVTKGFID